MSHDSTSLVVIHYENITYYHPAGHYTYSLSPTKYLASPVLLLLGQEMHCTLPVSPHRSVSRLRRRGRPVSNVARGYKLGLLSTAHASPADAAKNEKCQFSGPYP